MNAKTVEALLFDLGGVVLEVDFSGVFEHLSNTNNVSIEQIQHGFTMDEAYQLHEKGKITGREYFEHLRQLLNLTSDDTDMVSSWNSIFGKQINSVLDAIDQVRDHYPCFAFTNTNAVHQTYWEKEYPRIRKTFDHMFVSSEIGLRKPDTLAFQHILKETSVNADAMLFFDDTYENIEGAIRSGLQTVHVTSPDDVIHALDALLKE